MKIESQTFPSIKADLGDWTYFATTMTFAEVAKWIKRPDKTKEKDKDFKKWLQREIDSKRLNKIAKYLIEQKQRFFNAIVVGIFDGEPRWYPVSVSRTPTLGDVELSERAKTSMGVLELRGDEEAFPIDGQHRVEAIKEALKLDASVADDELCVIFVAHKTNKKGRERTRRLFTTLNKYARPVSIGEIVALDEDDVFAITTRKIVDEYEPLNKGFVTFTKTPNLPANDEKGITTTVALYQLVDTLALPKGSRRYKLKVGPPEEETIQEIYESHCEFWNYLIKYVPALEQVTSSSPEMRLAGEFRENGGHLLFRPVGQQAFATAVRIMMDRDIEMDRAVLLLSSTELRLGAKPWRHVLWNPSTNNMITKHKKLAYNLFLHMAGQELSPKDYSYEDLLTDYRKVLDDEKATLNRKNSNENKRPKKTT
jgi:DNA sulfur modification protein DndB